MGLGITGEEKGNIEEEKWNKGEGKKIQEERRDYRRREGNKGDEKGKEYKRREGNTGEGKQIQEKGIQEKRRE